MPRRIRLTTLVALAVLAACNRPPVPGVARGADLYTTCAKCHGSLGEGSQELAAPNIGGMPAWYVQGQLQNFAASHRGYDPFDTAGIRMKSVAWTLDRPGDDSSVALYVATLAPPRSAPVLHGNAAGGEAAFQICAACHGAAAEGNEAVHAPPLAGRNDWYLLSQLHKFKRGQRGTRPQDIWGQTMRPQAMMLDDSTIANVVAYIQTLGAAR